MDKRDATTNKENASSPCTSRDVDSPTTVLEGCTASESSSPVLSDVSAEERTAMTPAKMALSFAPVGSVQQVRGTVSVVKTPHAVAQNEWFDDVSIYTEGDDANGVIVTETTSPRADMFPSMQRILNSVQKSIQKLTTKSTCTIGTNTTPSLVRCIFTEPVAPIEMSAPIEPVDKSSVIQKVSIARAAWLILIAILVTFGTCFVALGICKIVIQKAPMNVKDKVYSIPTMKDTFTPIQGSTIVPLSSKRQFEFPTKAFDLKDKVVNRGKEVVDGVKEKLQLLKKTASSLKGFVDGAISLVMHQFEPNSELSQRHAETRMKTQMVLKKFSNAVVHSAKFAKFVVLQSILFMKAAVFYVKDVGIPQAKEFFVTAKKKLSHFILNAKGKKQDIELFFQKNKHYLEKLVRLKNRAAEKARDFIYVLKAKLGRNQLVVASNGAVVAA